MGYLSGPLSLLRFNRRFHALAHRLSDVIDLLATVRSCTASSGAVLPGFNFPADVVWFRVE